MQPFTTITATGMPLRESNVDTDQLVPAQFLKRVTKTGYDDALFHGRRHDPEFVLNRAEFRGAEILVAGPQFGTGSSREHAVWALRDYGFRAVISPRFGDIFRGNSGKQGLLTAVVTEAEVAELWAAIEADPAVAITVDLTERSIRFGQRHVTFQISDAMRWRLLEGLDDIDLTLRDDAQISRFEQHRRRWLPTTKESHVRSRHGADAAPVP